jgi:hypothetical protein
VFSAPIIRSTIKTADAIIGTVYVSVWFKSVERCPRSGVYRHMYSNLAEKNKYDCLKLHHVGYLIKYR